MHCNGAHLRQLTAEGRSEVSGRRDELVRHHAEAPRVQCGADSVERCAVRLGSGGCAGGLKVGGDSLRGRPWAGEPHRHHCVHLRRQPAIYQAPYLLACSLVASGSAPCKCIACDLNHRSGGWLAGPGMQELPGRQFSDTRVSKMRSLAIHTIEILHVESTQLCST